MTESKYFPIFPYWKRDISILIILLLIIGSTATCCILSSFPQEVAEEKIYFLLLKAILLIFIIIGLCIIILRLINIYSENIEKERNILSDLYAEEQKRMIVKNDKKEADNADEKLKKEILLLNKQLKELEHSHKQQIEQIEAKIHTQYQDEKIKYLEEINKQLLANKK